MDEGFDQQRDGTTLTELYGDDFCRNLRCVTSDHEHGLRYALGRYCADRWGRSFDRC